MRYKINDFFYNDEKGIVEKNEKIIQLTKTQKALLNYFISHPNKTLSKQVLMEDVWQRIVNDNSVNKSISKLRAILEKDPVNPEIIVTVFGHGFSFEGNIIDATESKQVVVKSKQKTIHRNVYLVLGTLLCALLIGAVLVQNKSKIQSNPLFLFVTDEELLTNENWLQQSSLSFIDDVFDLMDDVDVRDLRQKPKYLDNQQYITNQFVLSPNLKVIKTNMSETNNSYSLTLSVFDKQGGNQTKTFANENLSLTMKSASGWLASTVDQEDSFNEVNTLIPSDPYIAETYLRGLSSFNLGEFEKAEYSFKLCLKEKPDFHLARLYLARVKVVQGELDKSLAILDTLSKTNAYNKINIEVESIRGDILDTQGKHEQAKDLFLEVLKKNRNIESLQINSIRFNLAHTYTALTEYDKALEQLEFIEDNVTVVTDASLLASVYRKQGSIYQILGLLEKAQEVTEQALILYSKLEDLLGEAKTYSTLARISTHQSNYSKSIRYLEKALSITKTIDYKLGVGATLNDLIYLLMVQGEFTKAWAANQEMKSLAIDIDYNAMIQIAKQYEIDISRAQKKWIRAEVYLADHLHQAQASENKRALLKNKMLALELYLDQGKLIHIKNIAGDVQNYVNETKEIRLQPRLNKLLGRYYLLAGEYEKGVDSLLQSKNLALETKDGETIVEVNNLLAEYYLNINQPQKTLKLLEESIEYNPFPYPYLLIKSKANEKLGNLLIALDLANECKLTANEFWQHTDDFYINELQKKAS